MSHPRIAATLLVDARCDLRIASLAGGQQIDFAEAAALADRCATADYCAAVIDGRATRPSPFAVARDIRAQCPRIPIVFVLDAAAPPFKYAETLALGTVDFLVSPVDPALLEAKLPLWRASKAGAVRTPDAPRAGGDPGQLPPPEPKTSAATSPASLPANAPVSRHDQRPALESILSSMPDAVIATDVALHVTYLNAEAKRMTGLDASGALGCPLEQLLAVFDSPSRQAANALAERALHSGHHEAASQRLVVGGADERWINASAAPMGDATGGVEGVLLVLRDITGEQDAVRQLGESHALLEQRVAERTAELGTERAFLAAVLDAVADGIVACDADGVLTVFNRASRELHGLPGAPLPFEQWADHYHLLRPDGMTPLPTAEIPLFRALSGEHVRDAEMVVATQAGVARTMRAVGGPLIDKDGRCFGAVVSMRDISAQQAVRAAQDAAVAEQARREEAEAAAERLRESQQRFELLLQSSGEGIYGMGPSADCTFINTAGARMLGWRPEDFVGRPIHSLIHHHHADGSDYPEAECRIRQAIREGAVLRVDDEVFWHRDGRPVPVSYTVHPAMRGSQNVGAVVNFSDISTRRAVQERLEASEERVRLASDAAGLGIWAWEIAEDRVTWDNDRPYEMFGLPRSEAPINAARFLAEFIHPDDAAAVELALGAATEGAPRLGFECRFHRRSDGALRWAEFTGLMRYDAEGKAIRMLGTVADITERKLADQQLRVNEERYRTLFESIDEGFCIIEILSGEDGRTLDYRFLESNPAFERHSGLSGAVGKTIRELVPDIDASWLEIYGRVAATGEAVSFENESKAMGRWFDVSATRVGGPGSNKVALLFNDITPRKHADADLRRLADDLAEADRRKTEFLATLAHELRNPLAPLRNGLHLMSRSAESPAVIAKARAMMSRQLDQMVHLVDDLLDVARITRGRVELKKERVTLQSVAASAVEGSLPLMESSRHEMRVDLPGELLLLDADPVRLTQVLGNLLNNAARYTPSGGRVRLTATREGDEAVISVSDSGIGIPAESLGSVFELFTQVGRNMERAQSGLGIGLTLVRRLVELHGGSVSAHSDGVGRGAVFTVRLPLAAEHVPVAAPDFQASRSVGAESRGVRVLVVDDNIDAAESMVGLLDIGGHTTQMAHDGLQAIRVAGEFRPDLVFLDIGMPGKDGYEVARTLRQTPGMEAVVLVALTGWGTEEDRARSKAAGFDHHLTKPAEFEIIDRLLAGVSRGDSIVAA